MDASWYHASSCFQVLWTHLHRVDLRHSFKTNKLNHVQYKMKAGSAAISCCNDPGSSTHQSWLRPYTRLLFAVNGRTSHFNYKTDEKKKNQIKETNCSCSDKVTFIIIITHFMIVTLSERPKLHICRGWKHPLLLNSLLSSHMAHVGSGQWKNISSPLPLRGSFRSFPFSFRGFVGCVHSLEDCLRM